jgi:hypothetical protein
MPASCSLHTCTRTLHSDPAHKVKLLPLAPRENWMKKRCTINLHLSESDRCEWWYMFFRRYLCYQRVATLLPRLRSFLGRKSEVLAGQHIIHFFCFLSFSAVLQVSRQSLQSCSKHSCTTLSMVQTGPAIMQEAFMHYIVYMVHCVKAGKSRKNCGGTKGGTEAGPRRDHKVT